jgi:hypothetical protein
MRVWTVHATASRASVPQTVAAKTRLVPEGFSWAALLFGPLWLLAYGIWLPGLGALLLFASCFALVPADAMALIPACHVLLGLTAHDVRRWALQRRALLLVGVVVAADWDDAQRRLWALRPDLARGVGA